MAPLAAASAQVFTPSDSGPTRPYRSLKVRHSTELFEELVSTVMASLAIFNSV